MEFPGHHHRHHHRRDDDEERGLYAPPPPNAFFTAAPPPPPQSYHPGTHFAPPPPPYRGEPFAPPPPAGVHFTAAPPPPPSFGGATHVHHTSGEPYPAPEYRYGGYVAHPPPPNPTFESQGGDFTGVTHVSHSPSHQTHSSVFHQSHEANRLPANLAGLAGRPTVKVYCKAEPNYYLAIRDGQVILALSDPSDEAQHWYKDEKYSTRIRDAEGCPCFALINKATGEALKHSIGETQPVQLILYDPDRLDESVLWTESKDLGDGYRTVRMVNDIRLNVDAYHGDQRSGGVRDGTLIVLWSWNKGDNQSWKIVPF
ncbi:PREDICTED: uncharacterized protein LOC104805794 [Tarenaya hassleriana]|uniref:uncharacterized protein LOC104805794 n=1 Tax=Tarenaya hassleriana TaxID=28532 RepID=UPI00053C15FB|nr:PREDICTED: uncharacterized protein LOC104805794 [Tarenaya hassleriana]